MSKLLKQVMETVPMNFDIPQGCRKVNTLTFVKKYLDKLEIPYKVLKDNIYSLANPSRPLLSAHMDSVGREWPLTGEAVRYSKLPTVFKTNGTVVEPGDYTILQSPHGLNIGADDRAGVALALSLLSRDKELNFIFSRQEEISPHSVQEVIDEEGKEAFASMPYCFVLDRKGHSDLIGMNKYCCRDFIDDLEAMPGSFKSAYGSISDGNQLMAVVPTVNISVGYYSAHTDSEYIVLEDWKETRRFVEAFIAEKTDRYDLYIAPPVTVYKGYDDYKSKSYKSSSYAPQERIAGREYVTSAATSADYFQYFPWIYYATDLIKRINYNGKVYDVEYCDISRMFRLKGTNIYVDDVTFEVTDFDQYGDDVLCT